MPSVLHTGSRLRSLGTRRTEAAPSAPVTADVPPALTRRLAESFGSMSPWGWPLLWQAHQDSNLPGPGGFPYRGASGTTNDRAFGKDIPFFWSEVDLRGYRVTSRYLAETNPFAIGFCNLLVGYHVRKGYGWQACRKGAKKTPYATGGTSEDPLIAKAQRILDNFRDRNNWPVLSRESFYRWRVDGEVFLRIGWSQEDGIWCRHVEPEQVGAPDGSTTTPWSYGIEVREYEDGRIDPATVLAYHLWDLESGMTRGEWVDEPYIVHAKANVVSNVKRGRPDFFPVLDLFDNVRHLYSNMLVTAVRQAAYAWLEKFPSASVNQVGALLPQFAPGDGSATPITDISCGQWGSGPWWMRRGRAQEPAGTILRTEGNRQLEPMPADGRAAGFELIVKLAMRAARMRWNLPGSASGDAEDTTFAAAIQAGGPFPVAVEGSQLEWGSCFERPSALKVLDRAVESGELTRAERAQLDIEVTEPQVVSPKPEVDNQVYVAEHQAGVLSSTTWQLKRGYDPQHEEANKKAEKEQAGGGGGPSEVRGTVGGLQAIGTLQQQVYGGQIPKLAGVAALQILFGMSKEEASSMLPDIDPVKRTDTGDQNNPLVPAPAPPDGGEDAGIFGESLRVLSEAVGDPEDGDDAMGDESAGEVIHEITLAALELLGAHDATESILAEAAGNPPFPGAVFDTTKRRWVRGNRQGGGKKVVARGVPVSGPNRAKMLRGQAKQLPVAKTPAPKPTRQRKALAKKVWNAVPAEKKQGLATRIKNNIKGRIGRAVLRVVDRWADAAAEKYAPRVAKKLGVGPKTARFALSWAIKSLCKLAGKGVARAMKPASKESLDGLLRGAVRIFSERALATKTVTVHRSDGTTFQREQKVATDDDAGGGEQHEHELADTDKASIAAGIDKDVAALPEGEKPPEGIVAKAKNLALDVAAKALIWLHKFNESKVGKLVMEGIDSLFDGPADMKKLGYNPSNSTGTAGPQNLDAVKNNLTDVLGFGSPIGGHLVASIASKVLTKVYFWAKGKVSGKKSEAVESEDGFTLWAELIAQLLSHLAEQFGTGGAPDAEVVEKNLRGLLGGAK